MKALVEAKDGGLRARIERRGRGAAARGARAEVVELKGIAEGAEMRAAAATKDRDAMKARLETVDGDCPGVRGRGAAVLGEKERAGRAERQNTKLQGARRGAARRQAPPGAAQAAYTTSLLPRPSEAAVHVRDDREKTTCLIRCAPRLAASVQKNIDNVQCLPRLLGFGGLPREAYPPPRTRVGLLLTATAATAMPVRPRSSPRGPGGEGRLGVARRLAPNPNPKDGFAEPGRPAGARATAAALQSAKAAFPGRVDFLIACRRCDHYPAVKVSPHPHHCRRDSS